MGMMERGGQVGAGVIDNRRKKEVQAQVRQHIEAGSAIFSDELKSYDGLESEPFHLFRCIDEQAYRFNDRKMTGAARFDLQ